MSQRPPIRVPPGYVAPKRRVDTSPNLGMQAAKASWVAPIIAFALNGLTQTLPGQARLVVGVASLIIYVVGLVAGITALTWMKQYGRERILVPAIVGICLNGVLVSLFLAVFIIALGRR